MSNKFKQWRKIRNFVESKNQKSIRMQKSAQNAVFLIFLTSCIVGRRLYEAETALWDLEI
jgi:hypothetical protein